MRKGFGVALSVLGGFLVTLALLGQFWAPGQLEKTPLDVDSTTLLSGTATLSNGTDTDTFPVRAFSITHADSERSDSDVVVFQSSSCLVKDEGGIDSCVSADDPDERLISASTDDFATDRVTALAVDDPQYLPPSAEEKQGLVNKWPFNAEQETYPYWDGLAGEAVDATFDRVEDVGDLQTYVYRVLVDDAPIELSPGIPGTYSTDKSIWIDPTTGSIVKQTESQQRLDDNGDPFLILNLAFTEDQVEANADDAGSNARSLNLVSSTVPLIGFIVGIPLLIAGIALQVLGRRRAV